MVKFVHASDLHLAKPFGRFDENLRVRLREARHDQIRIIGDIARAHRAEFVLLAGDTFDAETPSPQVIRHALRAFALEKDIIWVIMPGNHDSLAAGDLWDRLSKDCPDNVILALEPSPIHLNEAAVVLPAPPTSRSPGRDLTEWMSDTDPSSFGEKIRIGLAHGSIQSFGDIDEVGSGIIPPDRPQLSGLDYLALGDWHGRIRVGAQCWYSGSPEADSFKHSNAPGVLIVDIPKRGATPIVIEVPTGKFGWHQEQIDLRPGDDLQAIVDASVPAIHGRRDALVSLTFTGRLSLSDRARLISRLSDMGDDFAYFESDLSAVTIDQQVGDLDDIDTGGALRMAADCIAADAQDMSRSEAERQISSAALARLYAYATVTKP